LKTKAIVLGPLVVLCLLGCQAGRSQGRANRPSAAARELPNEELAAGRPVPKRTDATRERIIPRPAAPAKAASRPARPAKGAAGSPAPVRPTPKPVLLPAPPSRAKPAPASAPSTAPARPSVTPRAAPAPASREATAQPAPREEQAGALVIVPSQGRPAMLGSGETFYFVMRLRKALGQRILVWLVHSRVPELRFGLRPDVPLGIVDGRYGQMILKVPENVPPGLYDLQVQGEGRSYYCRHSVKVIDRWRDRFRIVHLSNMNIDDPAAPEFDELLIDEINLLSPAFVVCTGDFTQWGRALGNPNDWARTLTFLSRIHAPAYIVCGDHDDEESFGLYVADNPIGTFDYGNYHGILMLDHSARRLDNEQLKWLKTDLANHRNLRGFNFIVMHNDELDVLDMLRREVPDLPKFIKDHRLRMIITGGHVDWDLREFAAKLKGLQGKDGLIYIRTHQSSTCMHDRATGISHYRVIDVDGQKVSYVYPDDVASSSGQHSIPVGRLRVFYAQPNDGSQDHVVATVQNALNQAFEDCRVWLRVVKAPGKDPAVAGGRLVRVVDGKTYWMCEVRVDLPDKGGVKVMAANTASLLPPPLPLKVALAETRTAASRPTTKPSSWTLAFTPEQGDVGLRYYRCERNLSLVLTNGSHVAQAVWPVVRLNGQILSLDWESASGERKPVTLSPGQRVALRLHLVLGRLSPGPHQLQVFFRSDPLKRITAFPVVLRQAGR